jgi:hypothetical protein
MSTTRVVKFEIYRYDPDKDDRPDSHQKRC